MFISLLCSLSFSLSCSAQCLSGCTLSIIHYHHGYRPDLCGNSGNKAIEDLGRRLLWDPKFACALSQITERSPPTHTALTFPPRTICLISSVLQCDTLTKGSVWWAHTNRTTWQRFNYTGLIGLHFDQCCKRARSIYYKLLKWLSLMLWLSVKVLFILCFSLGGRHRQVSGRGCKRFTRKRAGLSIMQKHISLLEA